MVASKNAPKIHSAGKIDLNPTIFNISDDDYNIATQR